MRKNLFWLRDEQWARIEPHLPTDVRGIERNDDRRVISGSCMCSRAAAVGSIARPSTASYDDVRFARWAQRGIWENLFRNLLEADDQPTHK